MNTTASRDTQETAPPVEPFHPDNNLPGCMMPDGGDCCAGHAAVVGDWHLQRSKILQLEARPVTRLTRAEVQSGTDRQAWAEGLIEQLPATHEGRNSWLMNYGVKAEAVALRRKNKHAFNAESRAIGWPASK